MPGINNTDVLVGHFLKTAENIVLHFHEDKSKRDKLLEDLQVIIKKNCIHDEKTKKVQSIVRELVDTMGEGSDPEQIMQLFKERKSEMLEYEPDVSSHSNLIEYHRQVNEIVNSADGVGKSNALDDDIEMTQDEINTIDPFTKRRMTNPVKNKVCGHVYDQQSVASVLEMNKNTRCPVVGCINKNPVLLENLVPDIVTRKYLHDNPA